MNKKGKIIGLALVAIMVVSLFAVAIPSITAVDNGDDKPDLTIMRIWVDGNNKVHYTIKNIGDAAAPKSYTGLWVDDKYGARDRVDPLGIEEESDEVFAREKYEGGEIVVCADYQDRIDESNELNNCDGGLADLVIIDKHETVDPDTCEFMVHFKVCNEGDGDAVASMACVYIDEVHKEDVNVPALNGGECSDELIAGPFDCEPCCTILNISVKADNDDAVEEYDEGNNLLENEFPCPCPDLVITEKEETVDAATCTFTVTYTVKNNGTCTAGESTTTTTDGTDTDNYATPELAPGEEDEHTTVTAFACDPDGSVITVTADSAGVVDECDEDNNEFVNEFLCCPDLIITKKHENLDADECTFTVTYTVKNNGTCTAGESTTTTTDGTDTDNYATPELAPGEEDEHTTVIEFACDPDGSVITVTADSAGVVDECDEDNNEFVNEFLCCPDLIITNKHETLDVDTCKFRVNYTVKNNGNCRAGLSYTRTTVGVVTDNFDTPALDPGEEIEHMTDTGFNCVPGGAEVIVTADIDDDVWECNEDNNEVTNTYYCCPDLIITEKEETVVDPDACKFTVTYTVKNNGTCKAGASTTTTTVGGVDDDFDTLALDPGEEVEHTTVVEFDCDPDGSVITVTADSAGVVVECNETNNDFENEFLCCPDLTITEMEETVDVDACTFTVTYTVKNNGNCKAGESTTTTTVDGVDDNYATPALDPGAEDEHTTVTEFDCVPGGVDVTVTADSAGVVVECNEGNNEMANPVICLCELDLVITDIWVVDNRIHYTIKNIGGEPAPRSYTGLWVDDKYGARDHVGPLGIGEESDEVFAREKYEGGEIEVCADYQDRIVEAHEGNNCMVDGGEV